MNDSERRESGHLMLITPERVFYAGLLGRPRKRCPGAFHIYVSIEGGLWLTTADGRESYGELAVMPPNVRHTIASDYRSVICLVIEPESVRAGAFEELAARLSGADAPYFAQRIRAAYAALRQRQRGDDITQRRVRHDVLRRGAADRVRSIRASIKSIAQIGTVLRRAGDGGELRRGGRAVARRASCICSRRRPASRSARSAPGSARGICCISPTRTSISRIWRRISAIPTPPISAIRSAGSTA